MIKSSKYSSGVWIYKQENNGDLLFFLVHPGGPFFANKHFGSWSIPKGEFTPSIIDENNSNFLNEIKQNAIREVCEETSLEINPWDEMDYLGNIKQKGGKTVFANGYNIKKHNQEWCEFKCSSTVTINYPPKTNKTITFPEVDKGDFFSLEQSKQLINEKQFGFIESWMKMLDNNKKTEGMKDNSM